VEEPLRREECSATICTPAWLETLVRALVRDKKSVIDKTFVIGRGLFIVTEDRREEVLAYLRQYVESIEAGTWEELMDLMGRITHCGDELPAFVESWEY
jgi:hypothetical protein